MVAADKVEIECHRIIMFKYKKRELPRENDDFVVILGYFILRGY